MSGNIVWNTDDSNRRFPGLAAAPSPDESPDGELKIEAADHNTHLMDGDEEEYAELMRTLDAKFLEMQDKCKEVQRLHTYMGKTVVAICHRLKDIEQSQNPRCAIAAQRLLDGTPDNERPAT